MHGSRPDPDGSGLDRVRELEEVRRRLYSPGGATAEQVAEFERLAAAFPPRPTDEGRGLRRPGTGSMQAFRSSDSDSDPDPDPDPDRGAVAEIRGGRATGGSTPLRRPVLMLAGATAVVLLAVAIAVTRAPAVTDVEVPPLGGTSILGFGRSADPATGGRSVTYQPQGYTVFQPRGRTVAVALRCVGPGRVRISAGARFDFRCTDHERTVVRRDSAPRDEPFVIMGRTIGDVVWSARVVLLDPPRTAGAIPDFRSSCERCAVIGAQGRPRGREDAV